MFFPDFYRSVREERAAEREAFLQTLATIAESFASAQAASHDAIGKLAEAATAQSAALQKHLDLFAVTGTPKSWTVRDEDEFVKELDRMGFPTEADVKDQLQFVLNSSKDPE